MQIHSFPTTSTVAALMRLQRLRIVRPMKSASLVLLSLLFSLPLFAQYQEFGVLAGASDRMFGHSDPEVAANRYRFNGLVEDAWYGVLIEPDTMLKVQAGEMHVPVGPSGRITSTNLPVKGRIDHISLVVDYRFTEAFGTTGIFLGGGYYRSRAAGVPSDSNYGANFGVNGDFPISRNFGALLEFSYHWINLEGRPRVITATGGLRYRF